MTRLLLVAAALVAVIAAAGVGAGATWDVYPGAGTPIQDAIDGAGTGDTIYVHAGTYVENVGVWKRVTLIGDGADVVMVRIPVLTMGYSSGAVFTTVNMKVGT